MMVWPGTALSTMVSALDHDRGRRARPVPLPAGRRNGLRHHHDGGLIRGRMDRSLGRSRGFDLGLFCRLLSLPGPVLPEPAALPACHSGYRSCR